MSYVLAYLHPGQVSHSFMRSIQALLVHDLTHDQQMQAIIAEECGSSRIVDGRNAAVRKFLDTDAEWLAFIDSDMGFDGDTIDRLIDHAHPTDRPIVGALAFANKRLTDGPQFSQRFHAVPTIYRWIDTDDTAGVHPVYDYPPDTLVECDATGGACFVAHRSVFETLAGRFPNTARPWFADGEYKGQIFSEDITFFRRSAEAGIPIHVHTGVRTSHHKQHYLTEQTVGDLTAVPTYVTIPFKDRADLTGPLVDRLLDQGDVERIILCDNGSTDEATATWVDRIRNHDRVEIHDCAGANIHQMWNLGWQRAEDMAPPRFNIAILNNDLSIGPRFLSGLAAALRSDPLLAAVGPNYDGRGGDGIQLVDDICAGRYDGTGGLPGFAFMVRGESRYRFPEQLHWWYGDNDLVATVRAAGATVGIVTDVTCTHIDGGGNTGQWSDPDIRQLLDDDAAWFQAKWMPVAA